MCQKKRWRVIPEDCFWPLTGAHKTYTCLYMCTYNHTNAYVHINNRYNFNESVIILKGGDNNKASLEFRKFTVKFS